MYIFNYLQMKPYNCYVSIITDGTSVSTFLCTLKTGAWRNKCNCSLSTQKLKYFFKVLNDVFLNLLYLNIKESCIIFILFLCQLLVLVAVLQFSCWSIASACILLCATPINWLNSPEWHNFFNYIYNAYSCR